MFSVHETERICNLHCQFKKEYLLRPVHLIATIFLYFPNWKDNDQVLQNSHHGRAIDICSGYWTIIYMSCVFQITRYEFAVCVCGTYLGNLEFCFRSADFVIVDQHHSKPTVNLHLSPSTTTLPTTYECTSSHIPNTFSSPLIKVTEHLSNHRHECRRE